MKTFHMIMSICSIFFTLSSCSELITNSQSSASNPSLSRTSTEALIQRRPDSTLEGCPLQIPRHPDAQRVTGEAEQYDRIAVYETDREPKLIFDYYDAQLGSKGWHITPLSNGNGLDRANYAYLLPGSAIGLDIYIPQIVQSTYQYTVALRIDMRSIGGFDKHCSHLYP